MSRIEERDHSVQAVRSTFVALAAAGIGVLIAAIVAAPNWGGPMRPTSKGPIVREQQGRQAPGFKPRANKARRMSIARGF